MEVTKTNFDAFRDKVKANFDEMCAKPLFHMNYDKDTIWSTYLDSFPPGMNEVYLVRRHYDCQTCKNFICNIGTVANINDDMSLRTVWDGDFGEFQPVADAMKAYLNSLSIKNRYYTGIGLFGEKQNVRLLSQGLAVTFPHFYAKVPNALVSQGARLAQIRGDSLTSHEVLESSVELISEHAIESVLDMIETGTLYRGSEWKGALTAFRNLHKACEKYKENPVLKDRCLWYYTATESGAVTRIKNHSIGTLLIDLTEGMKEDKAMKKYESIMAPSNYKRPKPVFTENMLEKAKVKLTEMGYIDSLPRRFATMDDISIGDVLFRNRDVPKEDDVFEQMKAEAKAKPIDKEKLDSYRMHTFIEEVLPNVQSMEILFDDSLRGNLCSLIAPQNADSKSMFKWDNGFSWAYTGNTADSDLKKRVEEAGGKVDGVLRFSIQWNDRMKTGDDLDAHCLTPRKTRIYFNSKFDPVTKGNLDVDVRYPGAKVAVENIVFPYKHNLDPGEYVFGVHNYACRGQNDGFRAEIEFAGQIYRFDYPEFIPQDWFQPVAAVTYHKNGTFTLKPLIPLKESNQSVWGLKTNTFIPVSMMCLSPNYWGNNRIGNKHYMFMLNGCRNEEEPYGFYNEYLNQELDENRKVMEALAGKMRCKAEGEQLSGLGFSSTAGSEFIMKIKTLSNERVIRLIL